MQSFIETLRTDAGGSLSLAAGLLLTAALGLWALLEIARSAGRIYGDRRERLANARKLDSELREVNLRCRELEQSQSGWNGCRKFTVARKVAECEDVNAFYLKPHDGRPLPAFKPGQYLTFQLDLPGRDKPLIRCYSLSDSPHQKEYYRVTIMK